LKQDFINLLSKDLVLGEVLVGEGKQDLEEGEPGVIAYAKDAATE
jgi:hypothetical protein